TPGRPGDAAWLLSSSGSSACSSQVGPASRPTAGGPTAPPPVRGPVAGKGSQSGGFPGREGFVNLPGLLAPLQCKCRSGWGGNLAPWREFGKELTGGLSVRPTHPSRRHPSRESVPIDVPLLEAW